MTRIVFTNGCFDVLHPGHVDLLSRARKLGDRLIVGLNSDRSVRSIKGDGRPVFSQDDRKRLLMALESVDEVIIFDEQTPERVIRELAPNVLVKGGDWKVSEIIGSDLVLAGGGEVFSLPLLEEYSSTAALSAIRGQDDGVKTQVHSDIVKRSIEEHIATFTNVTDSVADAVRKGGEILIDTFKASRKVLVCGNGGSAADAQHIAAEFVGRYEAERQSLPAIALTTDSSALTAIGNDYGFERVFARQVESLALDGDCLIAISTSGSSPNIVAAVMEARRRGCRVIALTGANGKKLASLSDASVLAPATRTARIQEVHLTVIHIWCEMVDAAFPHN